VINSFIEDNNLVARFCKFFSSVIRSTGRRLNARKTRNICIYRLDQVG